MVVGIRRPVLIAATLGTAAVAGGTSSAAAAPRPGAATFKVGAAVELINPARKVYLGGFQSGPAGGTIRRHLNPLTGQPENLTVRAVAIASRSGIVEMASIDGQGSFAGYLEGRYGLSDMRAEAASYLRK